MDKPDKVVNGRNDARIDIVMKFASLLGIPIFDVENISCVCLLSWINNDYEVI